MTPPAVIASDAMDDVTCVTVEVAGQAFGVPITHVRDVFVIETLTRVPLARPEIAGLLNLRGRVVTAIDLRTRFGLPALDPIGRKAVGVDLDRESFGLIVDQVGDVRRFEADALESVPVNLDRRWAALATGVTRIDGGILVFLDVDAVLDLSPTRQAA